MTAGDQASVRVTGRVRQERLVYNKDTQLCATQGHPPVTHVV